MTSSIDENRSTPSSWFGFHELVRDHVGRLGHATVSGLREVIRARALEPPPRVTLSRGASGKPDLGMANSGQCSLRVSLFDEVRWFAASAGFADGEKRAKPSEGLSLLDIGDRYSAGAEWCQRCRKIGRKWVRKPFAASSSSL